MGSSLRSQLRQASSVYRGEACTGSNTYGRRMCLIENPSGNSADESLHNARCHHACMHRLSRCHFVDLHSGRLVPHDTPGRYRFRVRQWEADPRSDTWNPRLAPGATPLDRVHGSGPSPRTLQLQSRNSISVANRTHGYDRICTYRDTAQARWARHWCPCRSRSAGIARHSTHAVHPSHGLCRKCSAAVSLPPVHAPDEYNCGE